MTTEAEEFRKQEERFEAIAVKISRKYHLNGKEWGYLIDLEQGKHVAGLYAEPVQVYPMFFFHGDESFGETRSAALRALCDRLEMALQGKTKNE